jgi:hypothetical protein
MRVARRTSDELVIEEGPQTAIIIGLIAAAIGAIFTWIGWTKGPTVFWIVGPVFTVYGLTTFLFAKTVTHRFERWRGLITIERQGRWRSRRRELPFNSVRDIVLEEIRRRGRSYYIYYITKQKERIIWAKTYDGSQETTLECFRAAPISRLAAGKRNGGRATQGDASWTKPDVPTVTAALHFAAKIKKY